MRKKLQIILLCIFIMAYVIAISVNIETLYSKMHDITVQLTEYQDKITILENDAERLEDRIKNLEDENKRLRELVENIDASLSEDIVELQPITTDENEVAGDGAYYGRLYIPSVDIDVGLYHSKKQKVTDDIDSANIFEQGDYFGQVIADHRKQEFLNLPRISVGKRAYIKNENEHIINLICIATFTGKNVRSDIIDNHGTSIMGRANYAMYTCLDTHGSVFISLWSIV